MHVPNRHLADVPLNKITEYLLAADHPEGGEKATFFLNHGFSPTRPQELVDELLKHVRENEVANSRNNAFGTTFAVDGQLTSPKGISLSVRSVWVVESNRPNPRFVTAYPMRRMIR